MKQATFKRIVYLNKCNKTLEKDLVIIITKKEIMKKTIGIKAEEKQTLPNKRAMKPTM